MPTYMIHLFVAKKVNPNAKLDFYIGSLAPDFVSDKENKKINHLRNVSDMGAALREFARKTDTENEYLKGFLLHLFVDWKWNDLILPDFVQKSGDDWYKKYMVEVDLSESYAFYNTEWAYELWEQMDLCDNFNYVETEFITKENIKAMIKHWRKWKMENKIGPSTAFPPEVIENFVIDAANAFKEWCSDLTN